MSISVNWATKVISVPKAYLTFISGSTYEMDLDAFRLDLKSLEDSEAGMIFPDTHRHTTETVLGGVTYSRFVEMINEYTVTFENGQYIVNLVGANSNILDVANLNQVSIRSTNSAGLITVVSGSGVTQQDKEDIAGEVWQHTTGTQVSSDLDNPDQYKADVSGLALESSVQGVKDKTDNLPELPASEGSLGVISAQIITVQSDLDNPSQFKADVSGLATSERLEDCLKILTDHIADATVEIDKVLGHLLDLLQVERGRWEIDESKCTMTYYAGDNSVALIIFELQDKNGKPTLENMRKRVPIGGLLHLK